MNTLIDKCTQRLLEESNKLFEISQKESTVNLIEYKGQEEVKKQNDFVCDLKNQPHAFVLACLMDRQIQAERAWAIPYQIYKEVGSFDIYTLEKQGLEFYKELFNRKIDGKKLHRFNDTSAEVFYNGICHIIEKYDGKANKIWENNPSSASVVYRFLEFQGCGIKIATMATNILARQFKIKMSDYYSIDISPDVHIQRVMRRLGFVKKDANIEQIIYKARELNPQFPGLIDFALWEIGRNFCKPDFSKCECDKCFMGEVCPQID